MIEMRISPTSNKESFLSALPKFKIPEGKLKLTVLVKFNSEKSSLQDVVNEFTDILKEKYCFFYSDIYVLFTWKEIVPKGSESISWAITSIGDE